MNMILASRSPRRKQLLEAMGYDPVVCYTDTEESFDASLDLDEALEQVAYVKARTVDCPDGDVVVAADTIVVLDGDILEKPADEKEAADMLVRLSGTCHEVKTGVCVVARDLEITFTDTTAVTFRELSDKDILDYVASGRCMDKAGAYGIQECDFVKSLEGSRDNVVGLPSEKLGSILEMIRNEVFGKENACQADSLTV